MLYTAYCLLNAKLLITNKREIDLISPSELYINTKDI